MKSIWDKTQDEASQEIAKKNVSEVQKQTVFMLEMLKNIGEAIQENKEVKVENIIRHVVGKVSVERPEWIKELHIDLRGLEKRLDYVASAIIRKEVVKKMDFNRPDWIKDLIPKEVKFPSSIDFSKPTVDELKKILYAIENQEKIDEVSIKGQIEIKKPDWFKMPDIGAPFVSLASFIKGYFDKTTLKVNVQNDLEVKVQNKEFDVNIKNHQKEIIVQNIKEITSRLDLVSAQLRSMGTTGSNGGGGTTQQAVIDALNNIKIDADTINLNTDTLETKLQSLIDKDYSTEATLKNITYPSGTDSDWSKTLTNATTSYALFTTAPTKAYSLVIYNGSDTDVYIRKTTGTTLGVLLPSGGNMSLDLGANKNVYAYCASAGKILQGFYTEIN